MREIKKKEEDKEDEEEEKKNKLQSNKRIMEYSKLCF